MNATHNKFDTADYEDVLIAAGLEKPIAKAHRKALVGALEQVATMDKLDQAVARIELAIANQNTKLELAIANQNTKLEGQTKVFIGVMSIMLALATAFLKFG